MQLLCKNQIKEPKTLKKVKYITKKVSDIKIPLRRALGSIVESKKARG